VTVPHTYRCLLCGQRFDSAQPEEAVAELKENFGDAPLKCAGVCDDCYPSAMACTNEHSQ
jgi:hypothetical protein